MAKELRITGLTAAEQIELEQQLGKGSVSFEKPPLGRDVHGELATATAVVIVTLAALRVLALYLIRKSGKGKIRKEIETVAADGSRKKVILEVDVAHSESPGADVLRQLGKACGVDTEGLDGK